MKSANFQSNQIFWICLWFVCTVIFSGGMVFAFTFTFMWFNINTDKILVLLYIFSIFGFFTCKLGYKIPIIAKYTAPHHKIGNFMIGVCLWIFIISLTIYKLFTGNDPSGSRLVIIFLVIILLNAIFHKPLCDMFVKIKNKFKV